MRVGDLEDFEHPLHVPILSPSAMQRVEGDVGPELAQDAGDVAVDVDPGHLEARFLQRHGAGIAACQAHLSLRRPAAHQNGNMSRAAIAHACARSSLGTPMRLISHSSMTPEVSLTRRRIVSPSCSMSPEVAPPSLMRKLQCFSETRARPMAKPRKPA